MKNIAPVYSASHTSFIQNRDNLLRIILAECGLTSGFHELSDNSTLEFNRLGFSRSIYISIAPEIKIKTTFGHPDELLPCPPNQSRNSVIHTEYQFVINLRNYPYGLPGASDACNGVDGAVPGIGHDFTEFYWETGGSSLDSGFPHRYICCSRCCKEHKVGFLQRLFRSSKPVLVHPQPGIRY